jgi:hypothetical protein
MTTTDDANDLIARVGRANERIGALREATDRYGNAVHFRMARYLEALHELAADLDGWVDELPPAKTHERRTFERDLGAMEDDITVAFAELESAVAAERGRARDEARADLHLLRVRATMGTRWWRRMLGRGPVASGPADEGGGAAGTES